MINLDEYDIFQTNKSTLQELSKDDSDINNIQYMTDSQTSVIDFDKVKTEYANLLGISEETADSVDALHCFQEEICFIEFKNGNMKNEKKKVKDKIRDSLLIFCDITKKDISYTRENLSFILVYNIQKNPLPNQLKKFSTQEAPSRDFIARHFMNLAQQEYIRFDLERFNKLYFNQVHTYSNKEFDNYLKNVKVNNGVC